MIRQIYPESDAGPAEYEYTNPCACVVCEVEFDRDSETGWLYLRMSDSAWGDTICTRCYLKCEICADTVGHIDHGEYVQDDNVTYILGSYYHIDWCLPQAVSGALL